MDVDKLAAEIRAALGEIKVSHALIDKTPHINHGSFGKPSAPLPERVAALSQYASREVKHWHELHEAAVGDLHDAHGVLDALAERLGARLPKTGILADRMRVLLKALR